MSTVAICVRFFQVTKNKTWKDIAGLLGIGASSSAAYTLRKHYTKNLLAYECHFDRGGIDPQPIINQVEASTKKKSGKSNNTSTAGQSHLIYIISFKQMFRFLLVCLRAPVPKNQTIQSGYIKVG